MNKMYMAVTPDEYELPLCVDDKATDLARHLGILVDTLYAAICNNTRLNSRFGKVRIRRVVLEADYESI